MYTVARRRQTSRVGQSCVHRDKLQTVGQSCVYRGKTQTDIKGGTIVCTPWQGADGHPGLGQSCVHCGKKQQHGLDNRAYTVARRRQTSRVGQSCVHCGKPQTSWVGQSCVHRGKPQTDIRSGTIVCSTPWQAEDIKGGRITCPLQQAAHWGMILCT